MEKVADEINNELKRLQELQGQSKLPRSINLLRNASYGNIYLKGGWQERMPHVLRHLRAALADMADRTPVAERSCEHVNSTLPCINGGIMHAVDSAWANAETGGYADHWSEISNPGAGKTCAMALDRH